MKKITFFLMFICLGLFFVGWEKKASFSSAHPGSLLPVFLYLDNFETETNWGIFEEIVNNNPCYGDGLGAVNRSSAEAYEGQYSLLTWANQAQSLLSNHVIGGKKITETGVNGILKYQLHALIAPETASEGQTGPEFSMQNTRDTGVENTTAIAGVQYIDNPYWQTGTWNVWHEGSWTAFLTMPQPLQAGQWYTLTLEANFLTNQYLSFSLVGGGEQILIDLSPYTIAEEVRGFEEAFVITLESENLWNNCGTAGAFDYQVYYDQLAVTQTLFYQFLPNIKH